MSLMTLLVSSGAAGNAVTLPTGVIGNAGLDSIVYSGLKFDSDGNLYKRQTGGGWSSLGAWLLNGSASSFYVGRRVDDGTLTTDAGGTLAAPLQLNTDRIFDVQRSAFGTKEATTYFELGNQSDGSNVMDSDSYTFTAEKLNPA